MKILLFCLLSLVYANVVYGTGFAHSRFIREHEKVCRDVKLTRKELRDDIFHVLMSDAEGLVRRSFRSLIRIKDILSGDLPFAFQTLSHALSKLEEETLDALTELGESDEEEDDIYDDFANIFKSVVSAYVEVHQTFRYAWNNVTLAIDNIKSFNYQPASSMDWNSLENQRELEKMYLNPDMPMYFWMLFYDNHHPNGILTRWDNGSRAIESLTKLNESMNALDPFVKMEDDFEVFIKTDPKDISSQFHFHTWEKDELDIFLYRLRQWKSTAYYNFQMTYKTLTI